MRGFFFPPCGLEHAHARACVTACVPACACECGGCARNCLYVPLSLQGGRERQGKGGKEIEGGRRERGGRDRGGRE